MSYGQIESTAVEIPSVRLMPVVVGSIAALAVVGFVLGLSAADDGGGVATNPAHLVCCLLDQFLGIGKEEDWSHGHEAAVMAGDEWREGVGWEWELLPRPGIFSRL